MSATIEKCHANGEQYAMPELLRIKAFAFRHVACAGEAERILLDSLACGRDQGAIGWELRTAIDLARLWVNCDRAADAIALLRRLRHSFSEGFETEDLRAADELLQTTCDLERAE